MDILKLDYDKIKELIDLAKKENIELVKKSKKNKKTFKNKEFIIKSLQKTKGEKINQTKKKLRKNMKSSDIIKINSKLRIKRRKVLPGITGMSQINYNGKKRELIEKIKLDINFVNNHTLINYFKILFKTPHVLIIRYLKNKSSIIK